MDLLKIDQVSAMTGVPVNTLRHWRKVGTTGPRSAKLGGRVYYRATDVQTWIDAQFEDAAG